MLKYREILSTLHALFTIEGKLRLGRFLVGEEKNYLFHMELDQNNAWTLSSQESLDLCFPATYLCTLYTSSRQTEQF